MDEVQEKPLLFEVSWEVTNKVGGIYTVISSKAKITTAEFGERYIMVGPYFDQKQFNEVEELEPTSFLADSIEAIRRHGIRVIYGKWLIPGSPRVILFDLASAAHKLGEWRFDVDHNYHIYVPDSDLESQQSVAFGELTTWLLREVTNRCPTRPVIAHFHEWQTGCGVMLCRAQRLNCATIFTTHATLLGRYICAGEGDLYRMLHNVNPDKEAGDRQIYARYALEKAAVHSADVFTTVSSITGREAQALLFRKPDVITPNGLNVIKFAALHEFQNLHAKYKENIMNFVRGHFYGNYDFDVSESLFFFTAGRYEYRNKGADLFLDALKVLNEKMKYYKFERTVVAFVIMPGQVKGFNVESLNGQAQTRALRATVEEIKTNIGERMFEIAAHGRIPEAKELIKDEELVALKRRIFALRRLGQPPVVTHSMADGVRDLVLDHIRRIDMINRKEDRVKVVYHPEFLSSTNPLIGLDYDQFVRGCHLGVFPSYYEPWGYTPAECTVMGIPSVCSNLSGFGTFIEKHVTDPHLHGIFIVDRANRVYEESVQQLADQLWQFCQMARRDRVAMRNRTERLSMLLDWKGMIKFYKVARAMALARAFPNRYKPVYYDPEKTDTPVEKIPTRMPRPFSPSSSSASLNAGAGGAAVTFANAIPGNDAGAALVPSPAGTGTVAGGRRGSRSSSRRPSLSAVSEEAVAEGAEEFLDDDVVPGPDDDEEDGDEDAEEEDYESDADYSVPRMNRAPSKGGASFLYETTPNADTKLPRPMSCVTGMDEVSRKMGNLTSPVETP